MANTQYLPCEDCRKCQPYQRGCDKCTFICNECDQEKTWDREGDNVVCSTCFETKPVHRKLTARLMIKGTLAQLESCEKALGIYMKKFQEFCNANGVRLLYGDHECSELTLSDHSFFTQHTLCVRPYTVVFVVPNKPKVVVDVPFVEFEDLVPVHEELVPAHFVDEAPKLPAPEPILHYKYDNVALCGEPNVELTPYFPHVTCNDCKHTQIEQGITIKKVHYKKDDNTLVCGVRIEKSNFVEQTDNVRVTCAHCIRIKGNHDKKSKAKAAAAEVTTPIETEAPTQALAVVTPAKQVEVSEIETTPSPNLTHYSTTGEALCGANECGKKYDNKGGKITKNGSRVTCENCKAIIRDKKISYVRGKHWQEKGWSLCGALALFDESSVNFTEKPKSITCDACKIKYQEKL